MYESLEECIADLEKNGHLIRIKEEVDPNLEMASIHLRIHGQKGPAILFENVKGSRFQAVSNLFGTTERSKFIFRKTRKNTRKVISMKNNLMQIFKQPFHNIGAGLSAFKALPTEKKFQGFEEIKISDLPLLKHWPLDGGAFITLPQVYSENMRRPGIMNSNLGMYRIQMDGNDYEFNKEIGLHYQIHRGIGIHQSIANELGKPLKISIFVGGPPSHSLAAVMPLPEGMSEVTFAGLLGGRRFRYCYEDGYCISLDADFVITGELNPFENKSEGPFGDHLGYYSLKHPFPLIRIHKVYAKPKGIWCFTVLGHPPQEVTALGSLIYDLTKAVIKDEIPGVKEVYAVDAAGGQPLLFAIGNERYKPFLNDKRPAEILTQANRILGTGQFSLAKFLFITAIEPKVKLKVRKEEEFLHYFLERIEWTRDIHFYTRTAMDSLDYSGASVHSGSKVVFAAYGDQQRELNDTMPNSFKDLQYFENPQIVLPGIIAFSSSKFENYEKAQIEMDAFSDMLMFECELKDLEGFPMIIVCDDARFFAEDINNFLWAAFTKCNPAADIYGVDSFTDHKHWGCRGPLILDARAKPHHAPLLILDPKTEEKTDQLMQKLKLS